MTGKQVFSKLRVIRIQRDLKNNSEYKKSGFCGENALDLVNLTRKFVRITRSLLYYYRFTGSKTVFISEYVRKFFIDFSFSYFVIKI